MLTDFDPRTAIMILFALVIAIPIHEFAHALSAVMSGDDGPRREGRLSIMPQDHFDPFGAFFCVVSSLTGFGLGWGRPVMVNPGLLNNPKWDMCKIAAWGPLSNLILAVLFALPIRFGWVVPGSTLAMLFLYCVIVNLSLFLFNLIPLGPLDGAKVVVAFLPERLAYEFTRFQDQFGAMILFGLIFFGRGALSLLLSEPMAALTALLLGVPIST